MRVTTNMLYDKGIGTIQNLWSNLLHTQQEVSTERRVLTPADDPIAASRALDVTQSRSINAQYKTNQDTSTDNLRLMENKLMGIGDILQYMRQSAIGAGDAILTQDGLNSFATDMRSQFDSLLSLANTQDVAGNYLFSGYRADTRPFQGAYGNVHYEGDQGTRTIQVSSSRYMPVSYPGSDIFDNTRPMSGAVNVYAAKSNTGSASLSNAEFKMPAATPANISGGRFEITFNGIDWDVKEYVPGDASSPRTLGTATTAGGVPLEFNFTNVDGEAVCFTVDITGMPANGDSFEVFIASKNVFDNLAVFIDTLERPGPSGVISGISFALDNIDHALDTELRVRAQIGSQLNELEQLGSINSDMDIQYATTLSRLQDCDLAEAYSRLTKLQTNLEAAQLSFMKLSGLSLFNFLK